MVKFSDKFGLPKDRVKLEATKEGFSIVWAEIIKSKKMYDVREETEQGTKISKKLIDIAYFNTKDGQKFYSPNGAIVAAVKDMIAAYGKPDGSFREPVEIEEVAEKVTENGKNSYLYFV